jgi:hypothetical protein
VAITVADLVRPKTRQLLFLHDLHHGLLDRLAHKHLEDGPHFHIEVEELRWA